LRPEKIRNIRDIDVLCEAYKIHGRALLSVLEDERLNAIAKHCGLRLEDIQEFISRLEPGALIKALDLYGEKAEKAISGKLEDLSIEAISSIAPLISSETLSEIINTIGLEKSLEAFHNIRVDYRALAILAYLFGDIGDKIRDEVLVELATRYKRLFAKSFSRSILRLPEELQIEVLRLKDDEDLFNWIKEYRRDASLDVLEAIKRDEVFEAYLELDVERFLRIAHRERIVRGYDKYKHELFKLLSADQRINLLEAVEDIDRETAKIALLENFDESFEILSKKFPERLKEAIDEDIGNLDDERLYKLSLFAPEALSLISPERAAKIGVKHEDIIDALIEFNPRFLLYIPQELLDSIVEKAYAYEEPLAYVLIRSSYDAFNKIIEDSPEKLREALERSLEDLSDEKLARIIDTPHRDLLLNLKPERIAKISILLDKSKAIRLLERAPEAIEFLSAEDLRRLLGDRIAKLEDKYAMIFLDKLGIDAARILLRHSKLVEAIIVEREAIAMRIEEEYLKPHISKEILKKVSTRLFRRLSLIEPSVEDRRRVDRIVKEYGKEKALSVSDLIASALGISQEEAKIVIDAIERGEIEREDLVNKRVGEILLRFLSYDPRDHEIVLRLAYLNLRPLEIYSEEAPEIDLYSLPHREKSPFKEEEKGSVEEYKPTEDDIILSLLGGLGIRRKGLLKKKELVYYISRS